MAEYYPLLSRAVAGLRDAPVEKRRAIYDRARQALLGQLRSMEPAVPEDAIEREAVALDESIAQIEVEIAAERSGNQPGEGAATLPPPVAAGAAVIAPLPVVTPQAASTPRKAGFGRGTARPAAPSGGSPLQQPLAPPTRAPPLRTPAGLGSGAPVLRVSRGTDDGGTALPSAPRLQVAPVAKPSLEDDAPAASELNTALDTVASETAAREDGRPAAPRPIRRETFNPRFIIVASVAALVVIGIAYAAWRLRDKPEALARSRAALIAAQSEPQPGKVMQRADGGAELPTSNATPVPGQGSAGPATAPTPPPSEPQAPPAVATAPEASASAPAPVKDQQPDAAATQPGAAVPPAAPVPDAAAAAPAGIAVPAASTPETAPVTATDLQSVPVAQRAALLVDAPDDPKKVKTYVGTVLWRTDSVAPGQGQPLATVVRADIDVPEAAFKLSMVFQKNAEAQFPASHTIELRFTPQSDNTLGNVKQINVPQMRRDDSPTGDPLIGLPVTITENYFLVGLSRGEATTFNLDMIKARNWFDVPLLLTSGKIAKITFEKGPTGQKIIDQAIQSWQ